MIAKVWEHGAELAGKLAAHPLVDDGHIYLQTVGSRRPYVTVFLKENDSLAHLTKRLAFREKQFSTDFRAYERSTRRILDLRGRYGIDIVAEPDLIRFLDDLPHLHRAFSRAIYHGQQFDAITGVFFATTATCQFEGVYELPKRAPNWKELIRR